MTGSKGFEIRRPATVGFLLGTLAAALVAVGGCGEQLTRMEENQVKLQALVAANARELSTISSQIHTGNGKLAESLQDLDAEAQGIAAGVQTAQDQNRQLQETVAAGQQGLEAKVTQLAEDQHALDSRVAQVQDVTGRAASDLASLAQEHTALQQTVRANQEELNNSLCAVASNQRGIQTGITQLQQADEGLARDIASVAGRQDALSSALQANQRQVAGQLTALAGGQDRLSTDLLYVRALVQAVATDVSGIAETQTAHHAEAQASVKALADKFAIMEVNQQNHQAGIDRLAGTVNQTAATIAAIAAAQTTMQETLSAHQEEVTTRVAGLSERQQELQAGISAVTAKVDRSATDSAAAAESLQESVRVGREVLTGQMAVSLQNQQAIQTSLEDCGGRTDRLSAGLAQVSAEQMTDRETTKANHEAIVTAMTALSHDHQTLRAGVNQVNEKADRMGTELSSVATEQKSLHETVRAHHEAALARLGNLSISQAELHESVSTLNDKADTAATELAAAAQRQNTLQQSLAATQETLTSRTTAMGQVQQEMKAGIADLGARAGQLSADVTAVASAQNAFRQMQESHHEAFTARTRDLADGQQSLRHQLDSLTATTGQTALAVLTMNNGQAAFQQAMQTGMNGIHERADQTAAGAQNMIEQQAALNTSLAAQAATVHENQQGMKADITRMASVVDRAYADLTAVSLAQDTLQGALTTRSDEIGTRVARVEDSQKALADNVNVLTATAGQTALDVMALANGQADLQQRIQTGQKAILTQATTLAQGQGTINSHLDTLTATAGQTALDIMGLTDGQAGLQKTAQISIDRQTDMQAHLDTLTATAGQTALDLLALSSDQGKLAQALQNHGESTDGQMAKLAGGQQQMQSGLNVLTATTGQTALDVIDVSARQDALQKALQNHSGSVDSRIANLADGQQQMQNGLNTLTATAGQTALDVIGLSTGQDSFQKAVQSHNEATNGRMAKLADNQQQMQDGLDAVTATTGQTALDLLALSRAQDRLEQTTQAAHAETVGKLAAMAQNQDNWLRRLDTAQAGIRAMADGIATLEQQLATLQAGLQTGLQDTATLVGTNGQQRQQFEAKITQDVQAMIDAIAQLRQTQAQLQEQMSQVQKSTQSQAETLKATLDHIKQPPAELKVSDAAKKVEPAVVQTGE